MTLKKPNWLATVEATRERAPERVGALDEHNLAAVHFSLKDHLFKMPAILTMRNWGVLYAGFGTPIDPCNSGRTLGNE
jgi:hypothetical protein